jgi:hypothetical protein
MDRPISWRAWMYRPSKKNRSKAAIAAKAVATPRNMLKDCGESIEKV